MHEVVRLYSVLVSIVLNRDTQIKSNFWKKDLDSLGLKLEFSIGYQF